MIAQKQIVSVSGCKLRTPVIRDGMLSLKTEDSIIVPQPKALLASTGQTPGAAHATPPSQLASAQPTAETKGAATTEKMSATPLSGYIVFFSALLLLVLRPVNPDALVVRKGGAQPADKNERAAKANLPKYRKEAA